MNLLFTMDHDRYVLNQLVTKIWEVEEGKVTVYTGNYSNYVELKELERKQQQEHHEKYVKDKNRLLKAAEEKMKKAEKVTQANKKMSKKNTKATANRMFMTKAKDTSQKSIHRSAKAIEQRVEQLNAVEAPGEEKTLKFHQPAPLQMHNKYPIMANKLTLTAGRIILLNGANFQFPLGATIAIIGNSGSGKTRLLRHILNKGEGIVLSPKVVFGVYEQWNYHFEKSENVLTYMKNRSDYDESKIRAVLDNMNLKGQNRRS